MVIESLYGRRMTPLLPSNSHDMPASIWAWQLKMMGMGSIRGILSPLLVYTHLLLPIAEVYWDMLPYLS